MKIGALLACGVALALMAGFTFSLVENAHGALHTALLMVGIVSLYLSSVGMFFAALRLDR